MRREMKTFRNRGQTKRLSGAAPGLHNLRYSRQGCSPIIPCDWHLLCFQKENCCLQSFSGEWDDIRIGNRRSADLTYEEMWGVLGVNMLTFIDVIIHLSIGPSNADIAKDPNKSKNANSKDVASNFKQLQQKAVPSFRPTYTWPHGLHFTDGNSDKESYESYGPLSQPFAPRAMDMKTGRSTEVYDLSIVVTPI